MRDKLNQGVGERAFIAGRDDPTSAAIEDRLGRSAVIETYAWHAGCSGFRY